METQWTASGTHAASAIGPWRPPFLSQRRFFQNRQPSFTASCGQRSSRSWCAQRREQADTRGDAEIKDRHLPDLFLKSGLMRPSESVTEFYQNNRVPYFTGISALARSTQELTVLIQGPQYFYTATHLLVIYTERNKTVLFVPINRRGTDAMCL